MNSSHRETASTEEQCAQSRNSEHRGTVATKEQLTQGNSELGGKMNTEERWTHGNSEHRGTVNTETVSTAEMTDSKDKDLFCPLPFLAVTQSVASM